MSVPIIPNVFHITYILNSGAAFGILENKRLLFILIALVILAGGGYFYQKIPRQYRLFRFGLSLMASGAIGNLIDRMATGYVIDFLDFRIWPIFNVADIAIVCGVVIMIYTILFMKKEAKI
jgi:signal peptidase II